MAAVSGRSLFGLWSRGFQPSSVVNKMHLSTFMMFTTRSYTCLTGGLQSIARNLQHTSNNGNISLTRYTAQQTRLVHSKRLLPVAMLCQQPTISTQSCIFMAIRSKLCPNKELQSSFGARFFPTLNQCRRGKAKTKNEIFEKFIPKEKKILLGPQRKGVCLKVFTRKPKKPNSGNRKCALLKLSNGKVITAYIPGERAVLQEHGVVLFEGGRVQDCPGIKYKIIRRKYDMN